MFSAVCAQHSLSTLYDAHIAASACMCKRTRNYAERQSLTVLSHVPLTCEHT